MSRVKAYIGKRVYGLRFRANFGFVCSHCSLVLQLERLQLSQSGGRAGIGNKKLFWLLFRNTMDGLFTSTFLQTPSFEQLAVSWPTLQLAPGSQVHEGTKSTKLADMFPGSPATIYKQACPLQYTAGVEANPKPINP